MTCSSDGTTFEGLRVPKESFLIRKTLAYKPKSNQKGLRKDPCQKMTRLTQMNNISVSTVSRMVEKMEVKYLRRSRKPLLSAAWVQNCLEGGTRLLNDLKNHLKRILIFSDEKNFTLDPVFNTLNDRVVTFVNNVSKYCRVSTITHPAPIVLLGVVAPNGEKMPSVWFERSWRLISAAPALTAKTVHDSLDANMCFWLKDFWLPQLPY